MIYSVTYDLNKTGQKYKDVIAELEKSADWARPNESHFLIKTSETAKQVYERVARHMDANDEILIIEVKDNYWGFLNPKIWEWLPLQLG